MADIAILVHWPPSEMAAMALDEFITWHQRLVERHNRLHGAPE